MSVYLYIWRFLASKCISEVKHLNNLQKHLDKLLNYSICFVEKISVLEEKQITAVVQREITLCDCAALFTKEKIQTISAQRVSTGFPQLDEMLHGGLTNGLYVLGAVPGLGKSTLALQISHHLSSQGNPVLYFALEMNRVWITAKLLCLADFLRHGNPGFQASDLLDIRRSAQFSDAVWQRIDEARETLEQQGSHLYLYEQGPELTHIGQIRQQISAFRKTHQQQYGGRPLTVVIDYLQILAPRDPSLRASDKQIVDDNVRELCRIRDQERVIVLLISALNRISYHRAITLDSFKESGSIEYSADVILGMQYKGIEKKEFSLETAKRSTPRTLELTLLKMRYGQDGIRLPLHFYNESSCFRQTDGAESGDQRRLQELRRQFAACPVQYHDGFHQKARRIRG